METPATVNVLVTFTGTFGNFVDGMSALAHFCSKITNIRCSFYSPQQEFLRAAKHYWFIHRVVTEADPGMYNYIVPLTADMSSAVRYELAYRGSIKHNIDTQVKQIAIQKGVPEEQVQKPAGYEVFCQPNPIYNRQHAHLINIIYETLTPCDIPYSLSTEIPTAPGAKDRVNKMLHANRETIKPGVPYILITDSEMLQSRGLQVPYPENWGVLMVNSGGIEPDLLAGLVTNPRCSCVVSRAGELGRIAAAHGSPCIIELADNRNTMGWECSRSDANIVLDVSEEYADQDKFLAAVTSHMRICFGYTSLS